MKINKKAAISTLFITVFFGTVILLPYLYPTFNNTVTFLFECLVAIIVTVVIIYCIYLTIEDFLKG